jgi:glucarate dehydratase
MGRVGAPRHAADRHPLGLAGRQWLRKEPLKIQGGFVQLPKKAGPGIEVDLAEVEKAHALYRQHGLGARGDAVGMRFLLPGWKFEPKRPALVP